MGWIALLGLAVVVGFFLWLTGFPRRLWTIAATGLMLGAAGYAWQGSPAQPGSPVSATQKAFEPDPDIVAMREAMFGKYGTSMYSYAMAAESMGRTGRPDLAVKVWISATRKHPKDASLWTGLALAIVQNDGNQVSPAAQFAFDKALELAPHHPGPPYFLGVALINEGRFQEAYKYWESAVRLSPKGISYRPELAARLLLLDRYLNAAKQPATAAPTPAVPEQAGETGQ